jgi:hypothetical protein
MAESLHCLQQFVAAYIGIYGQLDDAIESWPRLPNEWRRFDDHLALLHQYRPAMAALLTLKGRESPESAHSIVANLLYGCAKAKEIAEGTPCPREMLLEVRDCVSELFTPVRQCLELIIQEIEMRQAEGRPPDDGRKVLTDGDRHLEILPGGIRCAGNTVELSGKPLACIRALYEAHHRQLDWQTLRDRVWGRDAYTGNFMSVEKELFEISCQIALMSFVPHFA